jgi:hypothetical protein
VFRPYWKYIRFASRFREKDPEPRAASRTDARGETNPRDRQAPEPKRVPIREPAGAIALAL